MKTLLILLFTTLFVNLKAQNNHWLVYKTNNSDLPSNSVKDIAFDHNGAWIATIEGLCVKNSSNWEVYNTSNSDLQDNYVRSICIDNSGVKWIGTSNGLIAIDNSPSQRGWTLYNTSNSGLPANNITAVAYDSYGRKWFGTWGGGIAMLYENYWFSFDMYNSDLPVNGIYDIKVDLNDNIWIATHGGGLVKYDGITFKNYNTSNSNIPSNIVYAIDFDWASQIWIGTELGLVKFDGLNNWKLFNSSNTGWNFTSVMSVKVDLIYNKIYFGTYHGLGICDISENFMFKRTGNSGISSNWVSKINIDEAGNVWIATSGGGISVYNENGLTLTSETLRDVPNLFSVKTSPNPVKSSANIILYLPESSDIYLKLYDLAGKLQKEYAFSDLSKGNTSIALELSDLPAGLYYYIVETSSDAKTAKIIKL